MSKVVFPMTTPEFTTIIYARLIDEVYTEAVAGGSEHYIRCVDTAKMVLAKESISAAVRQFMTAFLELCREARIQGLQARERENE